MPPNDWSSASAHQYIKFDLGDIDYRQVFYYDGCASVNYLVGLRYANLRQQFTSQFDSEITERVNTQVNFEGGGFQTWPGRHVRTFVGNVFVYGTTTAKLPRRRNPRHLPSKAARTIR